MLRNRAKSQAKRSLRARGSRGLTAAARPGLSIPSDDRTVRLSYYADRHDIERLTAVYRRLLAPAKTSASRGIGRAN